MSSSQTLEDRILAALELALDEGQTEAAEYLLRALERLCREVLVAPQLRDGRLVPRHSDFDRLVVPGIELRQRLGVDGQGDGPGDPGLTRDEPSLL